MNKKEVRMKRVIHKVDINQSHVTLFRQKEVPLEYLFPYMLLLENLSVVIVRQLRQWGYGAGLIYLRGQWVSWIL